MAVAVASMTMVWTGNAMADGMLVGVDGGLVSHVQSSFRCIPGRSLPLPQLRLIDDESPPAPRQLARKASARAQSGTCHRGQSRGSRTQPNSVWIWANSV